MKIYMIRHGQTEWNKEKRLQGRSDIPLNEYGIYLARITADSLKSIPFDRVYTSPLIRASETARIMAGNRPIPILEDDRLTEMCFGGGEGASLAEIAANPNLPIYNFLHDPDAYIPSSGGETFEQLYARCDDFIKSTVLPAEGSCENIMIVSHGGSIRGLIHCITGRPTKDFWINTHKNCCVTIATCENGCLSLDVEAKTYYTENVEATW